MGGFHLAFLLSCQFLPALYNLAHLRIHLLQMPVLFFQFSQMLEDARVNPIVFGLPLLESRFAEPMLSA